MNVTRAVLPVMRKQRSGHVVTISSSAGFAGFEYGSAYAASKFAVDGWMESLAPEIEPFGIHATVVNPGFFRTELLTKESTNYAPTTIEDYAERNVAQHEFWDGMNGKQAGDPVKLAQALVTITELEQPPLRFIAGADAIAQAEEKLAERQQQIDAHRDLSSSLAFTDPGGAGMNITALDGTVALITGASSGIGDATARRLAEHGANVVVVARRKDRLDTLVSEIEASGGTALAVQADITDRDQANRAVRSAVAQFGRLDILINNAGLMLLGPVVGADVEEWERMIAVNQSGLLYVTHAALPHLLAAAQDELRGVADIVNISSIAGRQAWANFGVYNMTKFGVNGFTEALRQEVTKQHVRVGVLEPGAVATELVSHNNEQIQAALAADADRIPEPLEPEDIADGITYMVTRPRRSSVAELWAMPTSQA